MSLPCPAGISPDFCGAVSIVECAECDVAAVSRYDMSGAKWGNEREHCFSKGIERCLLGSNQACGAHNQLIEGIVIWQMVERACVNLHHVETVGPRTVYDIAMRKAN